MWRGLHRAYAEAQVRPPGRRAACSTGRLRHTREIAKSYARLFITDVVGEEGIGGRPAEDWDRLSEALERLRPLAMEAIRASFEQAMGELVERQLERFIRRK